MFIRDEKGTPDELANWRYGFDCDDEWDGWYLNLGNSFDEIFTALYGA